MWSRWRSPPGALIGGIRNTGTPCLLECRTYRFRAHSMFDAQLYRRKQEIEAWRQARPDRCNSRPGCSRTA